MKLTRLPDAQSAPRTDALSNISAADLEDVALDATRIAVTTDALDGIKQPTKITTPKRAQQPARSDVIIIGAGMAGISAARELTARGLSVVVLEAQERVGGRALSDNKRFSVPMDMGAAWLHGVKDNVLAPIADAMGMKRVRTDLAGHLYVDGRLATPAELSEYEAELETLADAMSNAAAEGRDVSAESLLDKSRPFSKTVAGQFGPFESSAELGQTSVMDAGAFESDQDDFIAEGIGNMVEKMAAGLPIEMGKPVKQIKYGRDGVEVTGVDGSVYQAKKVIVTVSTGILAADRIKFDPPLPEWKNNAISAVPMGLLDKVVLEFDDNVFGDTKENVWVALHETATDVPMSFVLRPHGKNIAVGFVGGDVAKRMEERPAKELVAEAMNKLGDMFGTAMVQKSLSNAAVTRWGKNPWTLGAYSVASPGNGEQRQVLARPIDGAVFFGGEAMARPELNASLAGAYETGVDAANMVARQLVADAVQKKDVLRAPVSALDLRIATTRQAV